ncbi:hypothetical protein EDB92DRAFT_1844186 [Lactarius akahatsu]|uniref:Uncharacterized protein n=1 Tax=Lactarius akahatsu TaxID=416441 RepID=A0AAD4QFN7_9AGAM|nr:hypothetical protein EDB92DRAFT_1844186 [Lactarius akahatsu]
MKKHSTLFSKMMLVSRHRSNRRQFSVLSTTLDLMIYVDATFRSSDCSVAANNSQPHRSHDYDSLTTTPHRSTVRHLIRASRLSLIAAAPIDLVTKVLLVFEPHEQASTRTLWQLADGLDAWISEADGYMLVDGGCGARRLRRRGNKIGYCIIWFGLLMLSRMRVRRDLGQHTMTR